MLTLGIDTSADCCAVALHGDGVVASASERMQRGHAERLMPMIDRLLDEAGVGYADLTRIAVCTGPGSFTGLRVGIAAARGLALGLGIPTVGVDRFAVAASGATEVVTVRIAGRAGVVFEQSFDHGVPLGPPCSSRDGDVGMGALYSFDDAPDVLALTRLGSEQPVTGSAAPLYLRAPDAAPSRDVPPVLLD